MNIKSSKSLSMQGEIIPADLLKKMDESFLNEDLSSKLVRDGYLLLRSVYDPNKVEVAREEILWHLHQVGEVNEPYHLGVYSGKSHRRTIYKTTKELGNFWKKVSENKSLRDVINSKYILKVMDKIFGVETTHFSFAWLRAMVQGKASPVHIDHPYMNRGTDKLVTCWSPLSRIEENEGTLYVMQNSHLWSDIKNKFFGLDIDASPSSPGHIQEHPLELVNRKKSSFLTTSFSPGDCLIFGMFTVHGSFDNNSSTGKIRLSCDTRFQPKSEPMDPRFSGLFPEAHKGLGYGCLSASLPLTETSNPK